MGLAVQLKLVQQRAWPLRSRALTLSCALPAICAGHAPGLDVAVVPYPAPDPLKSPHTVRMLSSSLSLAPLETPIGRYAAVLASAVPRKVLGNVVYSLVCENLSISVP